VTREHDGPLPSEAAVRAALAGFVGEIEQVPPMYSSVKRHGVPLYRLARRGEEVEREPRRVRIIEIRMHHYAPPEIGVEVTCSPGTYVRTLAHDLGERLGCGAHLAALRRTAIGPFTVEGAGSPARDGGWDEAAFRARERTPAEAVSFLPRVRVTPEESARLRHGAPPSIGEDRIERVEEPGPLPPGATGWPIALLDGAGTLLALAHPWDEQKPGLPLRLQRVLVGD
jgi:tRNA pseudouridine55 synthase